MNSGIDYPWICEMFICAIDISVHYPWIVKCDVAPHMDSAKQLSTLHGLCKMNLHYPQTLEYIMCEYITIHR